MNQTSFKTMGPVVLTGLGVGWLCGLSASPVTATVLTSLLGLAAAGVAAFAGVELSEKRKGDDNEKAAPEPRRIRGQVNATPIACLVLSVAVAASMGVYARSHNWLGSSEAPNLNVSDAKEEKEKNEKPPAATFRDGVLFTQTGVDSAKVSALANPGEILLVLAASRNPQVKKFAATLGGKNSADLTASDVLKAFCREFIRD